MFNKLVAKYKAWRAECNVVNAKIKVDREARRLKAEEDTKKRLKDIQDAEAKRREEKQTVAREAFKRDVYHAITSSDLYLMDAYHHGGIEDKVSWLFSGRGSVRRHVIRCIMMDPLRDADYFKKLLDEEIDRYSREEVEGCNKYYALKATNDRISLDRWQYGKEDPTAHIVKAIRRNVSSRAYDEVLAFNTLQWPTIEEIVNHPDLDLSLKSLPYQRHKLVSEEMITTFKWTITSSRITRAIEGLYFVGDLDWSLDRPYNKQMRELLIRYIIDCLNEEWQHKLERIEKRHKEREVKIRDRHLKRNNVSRQKSLTTGPNVPKRFPVTRSF